MLELEALTVSVAGRDLLIESDLRVNAGEKVGLVGRNGVGKTSLLRAIVGELGTDAGKIRLRGDASIGWLPQTAVSGSTRTLWDEARSRMTAHDALLARLDAAEKAVERGEPGAVERLDAATQAFRVAGGYAVDERIGEVLHGLGFRKDDWTRTCDTFSGGWQMRIALARLLLSDANLLLLDEPTNHLDLWTRSWFSRFLERSPHTVVVVSHDRHLLDRVCSRVVEVRGLGLDTYTGNYSAWLAQRALRLEQQQAAFERQQGEIERLERFVDRFGAKATKASQAQARQKRLDAMERLEAPEQESRPRLRLPPSEARTTDAVALRRSTFGWPGRPPLYSALDLDIERGMRVAILGPNGAGKSTLLHALSGRIALASGQRRVGADIRIGVFTQDLAQDLPKESSALDIVLARCPRALPGQVRAALGALGLTGDAALLPVASLSGGEKARVALATFVCNPYDVLLLDEPTNHLDLVTIEVLADALIAFDGTIVFVTHDRHFVERVATHVVHVGLEACTLRAGVHADDFEPRTLTRESTVEQGSGGVDHAERKRRQRDRDRKVRRVESIQAEIEALERQMQQIDEQLVEVATHYARAAALAAERDGLEAKHSALFEEWAQLDADLAAG